MNILVTGANGQLGKCFRDYVDFFDEERYKVHFTDHKTLDITNYEAVTEFVNENHIEMVLNFAAYTNVPGAETDVEQAYKVNTLGPGYLASAMCKCGGILVHISTDYVYTPYNGWDGAPFAEEDVWGFPNSKYGLTKRFGEIAIVNSGCRYFIIRTSWLYSTYGNNFMKKVCNMLENATNETRLRFVCDQVGTPTSAHSLAWFIKDYIANGRYEEIDQDIVNYSQAGVCSWYDFARAIRTFAGYITGKEYPEISPCYTREFLPNVERPFYSVMSKEKLFDLFPAEKTIQANWRDTLKAVMIDYHEKCDLK